MTGYRMVALREVNVLCAANGFEQTLVLPQGRNTGYWDIAVVGNNQWLQWTSLGGCATVRSRDYDIATY